MESKISEYEKERMKRIQKNEEVLKELGLPAIARSTIKKPAGRGSVTYLCDFDAHLCSCLRSVALAVGFRVYLSRCRSC